MRWVKLGRIYTPTAVHPKLESHAANPLPVAFDGDVFRVFYSGRDAHKRSSVGFVDIDIVRREVVQIGENPVFEHGPENSFYAHGVSIGNCYEAGGQRFILFMGWQNPPSGHWRGDIGRLRLEADFSLSLVGDAPLIGSDDVDPLSLSYPWVMPNPNDGFWMWYGSTLAWDAGNGEMLHVIQFADSLDGERWQKRGTAVPYRKGQAQAFSHPTVIGSKHEGYHMWFSYRGGDGRSYRIGYAFSEDALNWRLQLDRAGIDVSSDGWDSDMIEYPFVFEHRGERYMLYNGNGYGQTGFGLAVMETS